jgi:hypothetical protein
VLAAFLIVVGLLGLFYLYAGGKKIVQSREQLAPMMGWVDAVPMPAVRLIGMVEVLGVLGLVSRRIWRSWPAWALMLQVLATVLPLTRGEAKVIGLNLALIVLAAAATWLTTSF